ncbi:MAG: hypothetical protein ACOX8B_02805 [Lachnospiraceae bacterium]
MMFIRITNAIGPVFPGYFHTGKRTLLDRFLTAGSWTAGGALDCEKYIFEIFGTISAPIWLFRPVNGLPF